MEYLKIIFFKFALFINISLGRIIKIFRGNKNIDLKDMKKIIFNRKDRIGDAVISKPFIMLFSKYIKEELNLDIEIEVECSKYNEFVFKDDNLKKYYNLESEDTELISYGRGFFTLIKYYFSPLYLKTYFKSRRIHKNQKCNAVYIDLVGDYKGILNKMQNDNLWFIGPNLGLNNYVLNFFISNSYVGLSNINLIESYINLVCQCFNINNFRDYVYKNIEYFFEDYNTGEKSDILVFVGNKEYRNLSIKEWYKLIIDISNQNSQKISIIDDNTNSIYKQLISYGKYPNNVEFVENNFSLGELKEFAKNFSLIIGIDGGGFNYIRTCTNSLEIFTLGNSKVWSIFTGDKKYKTIKFGKYIYKECVINGKNFGYVNKKNIILPSFDYNVSKKMFKDIPTNEISKIIQKNYL